ncbi:MAG: ASCH domain-containing protein [Chitinophagaceae bacterium]|nr:ASCH domain-containing protein [Panacibacter sp.]
MKWKEKLIKLVENEINNDQNAKLFYDNERIDNRRVGVHLAIFTEPFLSLLLSGKKTIESRFSLKKLPPFDKVKFGDIVFIKKSGGDVVGYFVAGKIEYYQSLNKAKFENLRKTYSKEIGSYVVANFWESKCKAKYVSLLKVSLISEITPIRIQKKDRTAWCVLRAATNLQISELWLK